MRFSAEGELTPPSPLSPRIFFLKLVDDSQRYRPLSFLLRVWTIVFFSFFVVLPLPPHNDRLQASSNKIPIPFPVDEIFQFSVFLPEC